MDDNVCTIIAQSYAPFLVNKLGKKKACFLGYGVQSLSFVLIYLVGTFNLPLLFIGFGITGLGNIIPGILYSLGGDIVDKEEIKTGNRADGIVYSMLSMGTKIGVAVGGSVSLSILGVIGFVANEAQTATTLGGINALTNVFPIVINILAAVCLFFIDITEEEARKNEEILRTDNTQ